MGASLVAVAKKYFKGAEGMKFEVLDIGKGHLSIIMVRIMSSSQLTAFMQLKTSTGRCPTFGKCFAMMIGS